MWDPEDRNLDRKRILSATSSVDEEWARANIKMRELKGCRGVEFAKTKLFPTVFHKPYEEPKIAKSKPNDIVVPF